MSVAHSVARAPSKYSVAHCSDQSLLRDVVTYYDQEHIGKTEFLTRLAEIETRELYLAAGYSSMLAYCRGEFRMSRDKALKRMKVARAAQEFPAIFDAIADGRIELSVVVVLKPHLSEENVEQLLAAAAWRTKAEVEQLLAQRVPLFDSGAQTPALGSADSSEIGQISVAPGPPLQVEVAEVPPTPVESAPGTGAESTAATTIAPPEILLHFSVDPETYDLLQRARDLISHKVPSGSTAKVFRLALELFVRHHEKRKYGTTSKPRAGKKPSSGTTRYIPAHVRNAVHARDQGCCTFVSDTGHRCESRRLLEFDHIDEFSRGGEATVENLRLRCLAHNQYTAKQTFGADFMRARRRAADDERRDRDDAAAEARARAEAETARARELDVVPWLRSLGFRADEAREAARLCADMLDATLEERVKRALSFFKPRGTVRVPAPGL